MKEQQLIEAADIAGAAAVRTLLDWARAVEGQVWLSPRHQRPRLLDKAWLVGADGWRSDWIGPMRPQPIVLLGTEDVARMGSLDAMPSGVLRGDDLPVANELLAEARWAVWPEHDPDPQRALLLAAIALEVKTPVSLREAAGADLLPLLDLLLTRRDETPTSVRFKLNKVAALVLGRSLKQHDRELDKKIIQLYEWRNRIAHAGATPEVQVARDLDLAVLAVFVWLDSQTEENAGQPDFSAGAS